MMRQRNASPVYQFRRSISPVLLFDSDPSPAFRPRVEKSVFERHPKTQTQLVSETSIKLGTTVAFESDVCKVGDNKNNVSIKNGISCTWNSKYSSSVSGPDLTHNLVVSFTFDWEPVGNVNSLSGKLTVKSKTNSFLEKTTDVTMTKSNRKVETAIPFKQRTDQEHHFMFEYSLTATADIPVEPLSKISNKVDDIFLPSEKNDAILVVDGRKLHVSKSFLSYHSDYFHGLFRSNAKEGHTTEIQIKNISYEDFALFCHSFYLKPVFPNDETIPKLLEMSTRFKLLSVIQIVEYHLIHNSKIRTENKLLMADKYEMPKLMEKLIEDTNTVEKAKALHSSREFQKLSDATKSKVLDRLIKLV